MPRTLIIGYGNPLRGDDGVGWHIAHGLGRDLESHDLDDQAVSIVTCHQLTLELAEPISQVDQVIFIDASHGDLPGSVSCQPVTRNPASEGIFSHHVDPATLLACAESLYGTRPADALLFGVSGESFGYTEELSPSVRSAIPALLAQILTCISPCNGQRESTRTSIGAAPCMNILRFIH